MASRSPEELTTEEGRALFREVTRFGPPFPTVILTGGDPLLRPDLFELVADAHALGLRTAVSPAVSERLTPETLGRLRDLGVAAVSLSLDGASPTTHDAFRGTPGTFDRTVSALRVGTGLGLRMQVNTTVTRSNLLELPSLLQRVRSAGVATWEVFFLIATGRGTQLEAPSALEFEAVAEFLYDASCYGTLIRPVEAPLVRRVLRQRREGRAPTGEGLYGALRQELVDRLGAPTHPTSLAPRGTLDGDGIVFVGYDGTVYPGGFLPRPLGNAREDDLVRLYREDPLLRAIRGREFGGFCGRCPDRGVCGGSRARSFAVHADPLGSDPACWLASDAKPAAA